MSVDDGDRLCSRTLQAFANGRKRSQIQRPFLARSQSLQGHQHRERQLDELFIFIDGVHGAADVSGDVGRAALLDPVSGSHDGGFQRGRVFH